MHEVNNLSKQNKYKLVKKSDKQQNKIQKMWF